MKTKVFGSSWIKNEDFFKISKINIKVNHLEKFVEKLF
jgi:hypothetical protein